MTWVGLLTLIFGAAFVAMSASGPEANWIEFYLGVAMLGAGAVTTGVGVLRYRGQSR